MKSIRCLSVFVVIYVSFFSVSIYGMLSRSRSSALRRVPLRPVEQPADVDLQALLVEVDRNVAEYESTVDISGEFEKLSERTVRSIEEFKELKRRARIQGDRKVAALRQALQRRSRDHKDRLETILGRLGSRVDLSTKVRVRGGRQKAVGYSIGEALYRGLIDKDTSKADDLRDQINDDTTDLLIRKKEELEAVKRRCFVEQQNRLDSTTLGLTWRFVQDRLGVNPRASIDDTVEPVKTKLSTLLTIGRQEVTSTIGDVYADVEKLSLPSVGSLGAFYYIKPLRSFMDRISEKVLANMSERTLTVLGICTGVFLGYRLFHNGWRLWDAYKGCREANREYAEAQSLDTSLGQPLAFDRIPVDYQGVIGQAIGTSQHYHRNARTLEAQERRLGRLERGVACLRTEQYRQFQELKQQVACLATREEFERQMAAIRGQMATLSGDLQDQLRREIEQQGRLLGANVSALRSSVDEAAEAGARERRGLGVLLVELSDQMRSLSRGGGSLVDGVRVRGELGGAGEGGGSSEGLRSVVHAGGDDLCVLPFSVTRGFGVVPGGLFGGGDGSTLLSWIGGGPRYLPLGFGGPQPAALSLALTQDRFRASDSGGGSGDGDGVLVARRGE